MPSQADEVIAGNAESALMSVLEAEETFRAQHPRYANLTELGPEGAGLISQSLADGWAPPLYKLRIENYSADTYALTVAPQKNDNAVACFVGCPKCFHFYADQTRIVRYNRHCNAATPASVEWPVLAGISNRKRQ